MVKVPPVMHIVANIQKQPYVALMCIMYSPSLAIPPTESIVYRHPFVDSSCFSKKTFERRDSSRSITLLTLLLAQVCDENTVVLVTNELRSAFDEFLRRARALYFEVEDVHVPEAQMIVDQAKNQRPKPVALKRLRRRAMLTPSNP